MIPGAALILVIVAMVVPVFFVGMWIMSAHSRLVGLRNRYQDAYTRIDVLLKKRYSLVPELVEIVKGYVSQESGTPDAVLAARNAASEASRRAGQFPGDSAPMMDLSGAESALAATLQRLFAAAQGYPELKADKKMKGLIDELSSTETEIAMARQAYNDAVMSYNTVRETFPTSIIATPFSFGPAESFVLQKPNEQLAHNALPPS
jgi:LemA protein